MLSRSVRGCSSFPAHLVLAAVLVVLATLAGCGHNDDPQAAGTADPTAMSPTDLVIVYEDGSGKKARWQLTCDPAGGTHPDPAAACEILAAHGGLALPPVPEKTVCTEIYGGPDKATVSGTWRGQRVDSTFSRANGCEISRWDLMQRLLPPGGI